MIWPYLTSSNIMYIHYKLYTHHVHSLWNKAYTIPSYSFYLIHLHAQSEIFYCPLCLFRFILVILMTNIFSNEEIMHYENFKAELKVKETG